MGRKRGGKGKGKSSAASASQEVVTADSPKQGDLGGAASIVGTGDLYETPPNDPEDEAKAARLLINSRMEKIRAKIELEALASAVRLIILKQQWKAKVCRVAGKVEAAHLDDVLESVETIKQELCRVEPFLMREQKVVGTMREKMDEVMQNLGVMGKNCSVGRKIQLVCHLYSKTNDHVRLLRLTIDKIKMQRYEVDNMLTPYGIDSTGIWNYLRQIANVDACFDVAADLMENLADFGTNIKLIAASLLQLPVDSISVIISEFDRKSLCPIHAVPIETASAVERTLKAAIMRRENAEPETSWQDVCLCAAGQLAEEDAVAAASASGTNNMEPRVENPSEQEQGDGILELVSAVDALKIDNMSEESSHEPQSQSTGGAGEEEVTSSSSAGPARNLTIREQFIKEFDLRDATHVPTPEEVR